MRTTSIDKPIYQENKDDNKIIQLAKNDVELDLLNNIQQGYNDWLKDGNEGSSQDYLDTLSFEELKTLSYKEGGIVLDFSKYRKSKEPRVKTIDVGAYFDLGRTLSSLSSSERDTLKWLLNKSLYKKD